MPLTPGTLSVVSVGTTVDSLASAVATGGTTPYTYQWYRSTASGFTPGTGNAVSGATAVTLSDTGLVPATTYYYLVKATDSAGTPLVATSAQLTVTTLNTSNNLSLANVINISVATPQTGLGAYNTANLALFTRETPNSTFGSLGYQIYLSPTQVATDFGTSSNTYAMAVQVFSQQPNILSNGGYLVIIPFLTATQPAVQTFTLSAVPASGAVTIGAGTAINYNDTASQIQTKIRAGSGLSTVNSSGSLAAGPVVVTFIGVAGNPSVLAVTANTLLDSNGNAVTVTGVTTVIGSTAETLDQAIARTYPIIQYFGMMAAEVTPQSVMLAAAALVQTLNGLCFFISLTQADVAAGGMLDLLRTGGFTQSRGLYYGGATTVSALQFMASYAGLGLSTNFNGSLTTQTMHLKNLVGVQPDPSMTQTLLNLCVAAGADTYVSLQGVPKVFCSGTNDYYDNQFNLQWIVGALRVAGFNSLAQTNTKLPQTENGMNILKNGYRQVCEQAITCGFVAPGTWTSPNTFGNLTNFLNNITQRGYYIFSQPVSQQGPTSRAARQAPLVQIAIKYAGAIHSSQVIVNVNP